MDTIKQMIQKNESEQGLFKAFIDCWFMHTYCSHKITLFKLESLCMHFLRAMLYSVDARMLLSNTRQC